MQNQASTYSLTNPSGKSLGSNSSSGEFSLFSAASNALSNKFSRATAQISSSNQFPSTSFLNEIKRAASKLSQFGNRSSDYNVSGDEDFQAEDLNLGSSLNDSSKDAISKKSKDLFAEDSEEKLQESLQSQDFVNSLNLSFFQPNNQSLADNNSLLEAPSDRFNMSEILKLQNLRESLINGNSDPIVNLDKEKLSLSIDFPSLQDLKSVSVQYDPISRSVIANIVSSEEVAKLLQNQVSELEKNLAKHKIKLESLQVNSLKGGFTNQNQNPQNQQRKNES
jgi:hypothetical protein